MSNFYNDVIQQQYDYGRQIQKQWVDYYSKYNLETMKQRQNSFLPSTPIIAAIGQLNETLTNMENQLSSRTENETEQGRQLRIKDSVQRQYDTLIDQFSKLNDAGILGKEHTLQSLLTNKPQLNAYIRSNIVPKSVEELITLANNDPELNALLPEVLEKIPSKYSTKGKTPTPTIMAPSSAVSDTGGIQEAIRRVENMRNNFLEATNRKGLPPDLDILYSYIHDLLDNGINSQNDERALKEAIFSFGKNLTDDLPQYKRDETDMFIDSDNSSNTSRLTIKNKPNADEQNDDSQQEKKKVVVQRNLEDPDYFSVVNLTESNNVGEPLPILPYGRETDKYITKLEDFFSRIPTTRPYYENLLRTKNAIVNQLILTDKKDGQEGRNKNARNDALFNAKQFAKDHKSKATLSKPISSASSLTTEALNKVAKGRRSNKKNKDKKETKKDIKNKKDTKIEKKKETVKSDVQKRQKTIKYEKAKLIESIKELPPKKKAFIPLNFAPKVSFSFNDNVLPKGITFA